MLKCFKVYSDITADSLLSELVARSCSRELLQQIWSTMENPIAEVTSDQLVDLISGDIQLQIKDLG